MAEIKHGVKKNNSWLKFSLCTAVLIAVFSIGVGFGKGTISLRSFQNVSSGAPENLQYTSVERVYDILRKNYDGTLEESKLLDGLKKGLVAAAEDPYTEYLTAEQTKEFDSDLNGTFTGIGAQLGKDEQGNIIIVSPIDGFPAEKAGLLPRDIVVEVNGKETAGWSVEEAVNAIRGEAGSTVVLRIFRDGKDDKEFSIVREEIKIPSVESKILEGNIGYIKISQFGEDTTSLATTAAQDLKNRNVGSVILDVRGNPGGLLNSSVDVSSLWLGSNQVVLQEKRDGKVIRTFNANGPAPLTGLPTVVLIDGGSASASEIIAGALKDNNVARLLGQKSFGKGSVQSLERLPDGSALKVTIARWFTPGGRNIDKEGIDPDIKVEQSNNPTEDLQLQSAINELKK